MIKKCLNTLSNNLIKAVLKVTGTALFIMIICSGNFHAQTASKYVGVSTCAGVCHKSASQGNQYGIWKDSRHSQAYLTLQTEKADSIALSAGFKTSAAETSECLICHTTGKKINENEFRASFDLSQGVQCESCHGAGSSYSKLSVMKNKDLAVKNGLTVHKEKKEFCIQCHNPDSPTYFEFNYDPMWEMIAHPKSKE